MKMIPQPDPKKARTLIDRFERAVVRFTIEVTNPSGVSEDPVNPDTRKRYQKAKDDLEKILGIGVPL